MEARLNKWQDDVKEELRRQRQEALFVARPASVLERPAFVPLPSDKPLSEIDPNFQLNSDRRAEEREAYEMQKKHREAEQEALKRQVRIIQTPDLIFVTDHSTLLKLKLVCVSNIPTSINYPISSQILIEVVVTAHGSQCITPCTKRNTSRSCVSCRRVQINVKR